MTSSLHLDHGNPIAHVVVENIVSKSSFNGRTITAALIENPNTIRYQIQLIIEKSTEESAFFEAENIIIDLPEKTLKDITPQSICVAIINHQKLTTKEERNIASFIAIELADDLVSYNEE